MSSSPGVTRSAARAAAGTSSGERAEEAAGNTVAALEAELGDVKDRLLRALADQENSRRVARRERDDAVKYASSGLAADLLETADNLERAIGNIPADRLSDETIIRHLAGVVATQRALLEAFKRHGIERLEPIGEAFDPNRHHALYEQIDPTVAEGTVLEVLQPGYRYHERLLRPAKVVVARGGSANAG